MLIDTRQQLLEILAGDEPEYGRAAALGPDALPVLREMVDEDYDLASRAVYVAGLIPSHDALEIIARAARREEPEVRANAVGALQKFAEHARSADDLDAVWEVLAPLVDDDDPSVRWIARQAAATLPADGAVAAEPRGRTRG